MLKPNRKHLQPPLISTVQELPAKVRQRLEQSWAGTFYHQFFCRLNEQAFAGVYANCPSRPNVPVNILVGLETLKAGFGWSDEEAYDHFLFDIQVRYALGLPNLNEGHFEIRSWYNFRRRLAQYHLEHGVNLLQACFQAITDQQLIAFQIHTQHQRMDSTQIASNILDSSRLQLAAELVQRLARLLSEAELARYAEYLAPYLHDTTNQFVYRIKGKDQIYEHLTRLGQILDRWLHEVRPHATDPFWAVAERFFAENFVVAESVVPKDGKELSSGCLQSLDDLEASYRKKGGQFYKGYVANVAETCHPENGVQLITHVQVAPNNVDDAVLLGQALPNLVARTDLEQLYTDGAFGSPDNDAALLQVHVAQTQSAIRGTHLNPDKLHLSAYVLQQDEQGLPLQITCPHGQTVPVLPTPSGKSWLAGFDPALCALCPFFAQHQCRVIYRTQSHKQQMDFTLDEVNAALRRQRCRAYQQSGHNVRAAVEATMRSLKQHVRGRKLAVRGWFRVESWAVSAAAMINIRRLAQDEDKKRHPKTQPDLREKRRENLFVSLGIRFVDVIPIAAAPF